MINVSRSTAKFPIVFGLPENKNQCYIPRYLYYCHPAEVRWMITPVHSICTIASKVLFAYEDCKQNVFQFQKRHAHTVSQCPRICWHTHLPIEKQYRPTHAFPRHNISHYERRIHNDSIERYWSAFLKFIQLKAFISVLLAFSNSIQSIYYVLFFCSPLFDSNGMWPLFASPLSLHRQQSTLKNLIKIQIALVELRLRKKPMFSRKLSFKLIDSMMSLLWYFSWFFP